MKSKAVVVGVLLFLLPFVLFYPYGWLIFNSLDSDRIVTTSLDEEHRRVHLGVFATFTFLPFAFLSFLASVVILFRRARNSRIARWTVILPVICLTLVMVLLILILSGR
jgi:hypothetical protein